MNNEISTCDFCRAEAVVTRQYLNAKNKPTVGDGFTFIMYCSTCGLDETVSQPLTEGEEKSIPERYQELIYAVESKWTNETRHQTALRYIQQAEKTHVEPQESNKEEEPSKKPSDRIKEIYKEGNPWIDCIIEYLDELHNQRKTIGCMECGNNIKI